MSDTAQSVIAFRNAVRGDGYLFGEINAIGSASKFSEVWTKYEFRHSIPHVIIQVDTEIGNIQIETSIRDARDGNLLSTIFESYSNNLNELIGAGVYIYPSDDFQKAIISGAERKNGNYHKIRVKEDRRVLFRGVNISGLNRYPNPLNKLHSSIQCTRERTKNTNGWLEAELVSRKCEDKTILYATSEKVDVLDAEWSFSQDISGIKNLESFTASLSATECLENETSGAKVWIKPVWDLEWYECRDEIFLSDDEFWIICKKPSSLEPTMTEKCLNKINLFRRNKRKHVFATDDYRVGKSAKREEDWFVKKD